jgi:hypothetical protein
MRLAIVNGPCKAGHGPGGGVAEMTADCWSDLLELAGESSRPFRPARGCHRMC